MGNFFPSHDCNSLFDPLFHMHIRLNWAKRKLLLHTLIHSIEIYFRSIIFCCFTYLITRHKKNFLPGLAKSSYYVYHAAFFHSQYWRDLFLSLFDWLLIASCTETDTFHFFYGLITPQCCGSTVYCTSICMIEIFIREIDVALLLNFHEIFSLVSQE